MAVAGQWTPGCLPWSVTRVADCCRRPFDGRGGSGTRVVLATWWSRLRPRWRWRALVGTTLAIVAVLGDSRDAGSDRVWVVSLWMGDRAGWVEVLGAGAFALVVPLAISVLWRRLWPAGAIAGVALVFLLAVTAVVSALDAAVPGGRNGDLRSRGAPAPTSGRTSRRHPGPPWFVAGHPGSSSQTAS